MNRSIVVSLVARVAPLNLARPFASAASAKDPIQQLFVDKIREYRQKASSTSSGLVDADAATEKALQDDQERLRRQFNIAKGEEATITTKFSQEFKPDSPKMSEWK